MRQSKKVKELLDKANQNDAQAQCSLGLRFFYGRGVKKNIVEAVNLLKKSAENGHSCSQQLMDAIKLDSSFIGGH